MKQNLSPEEIDRIVIAHGDDDSAWEKPIRVRRKKSASLAIPADLAADYNGRNGIARTIT